MDLPGHDVTGNENNYRMESERTSPIQSSQPFLMEFATLPVMTYNEYGNSSFYYVASPLLSGYQNYTQTTGNPAVAAPPRFPGPPAIAAPANVQGPYATTTPLTGSVSVSPNALTGSASSPGSTAHLSAGGHYTSPRQATPNLYRGPSPGFNYTPVRGSKRKNEDSASDSGDSKQDNTSRHSTNGQNEHYNLYCKTCRVTLNAPAQAKQHYEGKSHAKRAKLHDDGDENKKTSETTSSSSSTPQNDTPASPSLQVTFTLSL